MMNEQRRRVNIEGHLVLPFGTATKADIGRIRLMCVEATGIHLESDVPVVYINKNDRKPLMLASFEDVFAVNPTAFDGDRLNKDEQYGLDFICGKIKEHNPNMTKYEELFANLYFECIADRHLSERPWLTKRERGSVYSALLPIPEMQIYVTDPLDYHSWEPSNNFRVDYGFWDGKQLIAIEIDGSEPSGYARDVRRDRLLRRAGVDVIHVLNTEIEQHRARALTALLPEQFWGERKTGHEFIPF
jgi:hypothetical protein